MEKIKAGVIGATGYAGLEIVRLLLSHPFVEVAAVSSVSFEGRAISEIYPQLTGIFGETLANDAAVADRCDVVFGSLPAGLSEPIARRCFDAGKLYIDMGADFRLKNEADYKQWYGKDYADPALHEAAVYCIPELHRARLAGAKLIGNPGCYPTSIALGLAPAVKAGAIDPATLVIDSKSGATGAGRGLALNTHYTECNEAFAPYKVASHRHTPEIEQTLSELGRAGGEGHLRAAFAGRQPGHRLDDVREFHARASTSRPCGCSMRDSTEARNLSGCCPTGRPRTSRTSNIPTTATSPCTQTPIPAA